MASRLGGAEILTFGEDGDDRREQEGACVASELRLVQRLLWNCIEERVPVSERDEVKSILGEKLIDENAQLFLECDALGSILSDVRHRTDAKLATRRIYDNPNRSMLEEEVRLLVNNIKNCAFASGDTAALLAKDAKERSLLEYVTITAPAAAVAVGAFPGPPALRSSGAAGSPFGFPDSGGGPLHAKPPLGLPSAATAAGLSATSRPSSRDRPATPRTPPLRPTSARPPSSRAVSAASSTSSADMGLSLTIADEVSEHLTASDVGAVRSRIRSLLSEEHCALLDDAAYLQLCLEEESSLGSAAALPPPSTAELKAYSSSLRDVYEAAAQDAKVRELLVGARGGVGRLRTTVEGARCAVGAGDALGTAGSAEQGRGGGGSGEAGWGAAGPLQAPQAGAPRRASLPSLHGHGGLPPPAPPPQQRGSLGRGSGDFSEARMHAGVLHLGPLVKTGRAGDAAGDSLRGAGRAGTRGGDAAGAGASARAGRAGAGSGEAAMAAGPRSEPAAVPARAPRPPPLPPPSEPPGQGSYRRTHSSQARGGSAGEQRGRAAGEEDAEHREATSVGDSAGGARRERTGADAGVSARPQAPRRDAAEPQPPPMRAAVGVGVGGGAAASAAVGEGTAGALRGTAGAASVGVANTAPAASPMKAVVAASTVSAAAARGWH